MDSTMASCLGARKSSLTLIIFACILCVANLMNCQIAEEFSTDCNQRHRQPQNQPQHRQQRKYAPLQQVAKLQRPPGGLELTGGDQEEFSLLTSVLANSNQQQWSQQQQLAPSNHSTMQAAPNGSTQLADAASAPATTPTMAGLDSIGSSVVLQPPVTTTTSLIVPSTPSAKVITPTTTTTTIAPLEPQSTGASSTTSPSGAPTTPIATTDASPTIRHPTGQDRQQASRRMDDSEPTQRSLSPDQEQAHRQQQQLTGASQPISSSPSSVSIITPLIGPPQQQHHTAQVSASIGSQQSAPESQQSMMRPIYVVGNPITERDYYSTGATNHVRYNVDSLGPPSSPSSESPQPPAAQDDAKQSSAGAEVPANRQQQASPKLADAAPTSGQQQQQHPAPSKSTRLESGRDEAQSSPQVDVTLQSQQDPPTGERMSGPPLVYSGGFLGSAPSQPATNSNPNPNQTVQQPAATPRLFQAGQSASLSPGGSPIASSSVLPNSSRRPSLPPPVNQANAASGFRSPLSPSGPLLGASTTQVQQQQPMLAPIGSLPVNSMANFYQSSPPYAGGNSGLMQPPLGPNQLAGNSIAQAASSSSSSSSPQPQPMLAYNKQAFALASQTRDQQQQQQVIQPQQQVLPSSSMAASAPGSGRRPLNITRVEHISAECSNDLIRAVIVFNGTFKGIIYSSGYVNDPTCLYVNGTGSTRYEFNIRLNQCGTLGRQELHQPTIPGEARRRDQVMWNTLSIQYNSIIEQEWDEHFRVSCEYGSDFWKTVSFNPFNVETNTGSPVVFTINPPQCQMDVLLGHGMGPKIAVDGPVTVGDPLTLLIHMKSEKAGYDILVKNCVAHNGGKQRMQLIDSNGCVVNERFISPFRGTYNDNDLRHVTLYAYLKAFRFTGSPVLYLECEIHMCQSACPPQMCYWRRLSKRSVDDSDYEYVASNSTRDDSSLQQQQQPQPVISDSLSLFKALQVRQEPEEEQRKSVSRNRQKRVRDIFAEDEQAALVCYRHAEVYLFLTTIGALLLLLLSVTITCCVRLRKLAKSHLFKHGRLLGSPSLLSIGGDASSIISAPASRHLHSPSEQIIPSAKHYDYSPSKPAASCWMPTSHGDIVRKPRAPPPNQRQYLASFAHFSPRPAHR